MTNEMNEMLQAYIATGLMPQSIYQILAWQIILGIGMLIWFTLASVACFIMSKKYKNFDGMYVIFGWIFAIGDVLILGILFKILTAPQLYLMYNWEQLVH
jgi:hypothetical protein